MKVADGSPRELGESIHSNVIELSAEDPNMARAALIDEANIISITQLGVRLRILIPKEVANPIEIVNGRLSRANIEAEVEQVFPDLEDVFVAVTELRKEAMAA